MRSCGSSCGGRGGYFSRPSSSLRSAAINSGLVAYALRCSNSQAFPCAGPAVVFLVLRFDRQSRKARAVMMMPASAAPTAMPATAPGRGLRNWLRKCLRTKGSGLLPLRCWIGWWVPRLWWSERRWTRHW